MVARGKATRPDPGCQNGYGEGHQKEYRQTEPWSEIKRANSVNIEAGRKANLP